MGGQPWPELEVPWQPMGSSPEREGRGKGKREGGAARGHGMGRGRAARRGTMGRACRRCFPARAAATCSLHAVREKQEGGRRKERKKKRKEKNEKILKNKG
jgi:hypothetical protein